MAGLRLGGLASGMDTEGIISRLMALEQTPKVRLAAQQSLVTARKTALDDAARQMRTLKTAVDDLRSTTTWQRVQSMTSSDPAVASARQVGSAPAGTVTVNVLQLARVEQRTFTYSETLSEAGAPQDQELTVDGVAIRVPAGTALQGVADTINGTSNATVYAGVVNGQLVLTGKTLGQAMVVSSSTGSVAEDAAKRTAARSTRYEINGVLQSETTDSAVRPGGLPGVELTLRRTGSVELTIGAPSPDVEKVKQKVQAFVTAYNATVDYVRGRLEEKPLAKPVTASDFGKGVLRNDVQLNSVLSQLRTVVAEPIGGVGTQDSAVLDVLAEIGVGVPAVGTAGGRPTDEQLKGKLAIDDAKLTEALTSNLAGVERLLGAGGATTGVSQKLAAVLDPVAGVATGQLARRSSEADSELTRIGRRMTDLDKRLALRETTVRAQFTAMEKALSASQSAQSWLAGQIAGLSR